MRAELRTILSSLVVFEDARTSDIIHDRGEDSSQQPMRRQLSSTVARMVQSAAGGHDPVEGSTRRRP
jgi:hypothetical protein